MKKAKQKAPKAEKTLKTIRSEADFLKYSYTLLSKEKGYPTILGRDEARGYLKSNPEVTDIYVAAEQAANGGFVVDETKTVFASKF